MESQSHLGRAIIILLCAVALVGCKSDDAGADASWMPELKMPSLPQWPTSKYKRLSLEQADMQAQLEQLSRKLESTETKLSQMESRVAQLQTQQSVAATRGASISVGAANPSSPVTATGARRFSRIEPVATYRPSQAATVRMPGDVLFKSGSVSLDSQARQQLAAMAQVLNREYRGQVVRIEGYSDADPIRRSNWDNNVELSQQRADAVAEFLEMAGVPVAQIESVGMGAQKPRATKALSRRAEVSVVMR